MRRRTLLATLPAAAALSGCGHSQPPQLYRLAAVPGPPVGIAAATINVRGVSLPSYLDQSGIVEPPAAAYQFSTYSDQLWAGSLTDLLQGAMVQDLQQRLPAATVLSSGGAIAAPRDIVLEIDILRFDPDPSGQITLTAQLALKSGVDGTFWTTRQFSRGMTPAGAAAADTVAAMSLLWGQAADQAAVMIAQAWSLHQADQPTPINQ